MFEPCSHCLGISLSLLLGMKVTKDMNFQEVSVAQRALSSYLHWCGRQFGHKAFSDHAEEILLKEVSSRA